VPAWGRYLKSSNGKCVYVCDIYGVKKLANSNLMQTYIESLILFGLTRSKLLTFLNRSRSCYSWTILSPIEWV